MLNHATVLDLDHGYHLPANAPAGCRDAEKVSNVCCLGTLTDHDRILPLDDIFHRWAICRTLSWDAVLARHCQAYVDSPSTS